LEQLPEVEFAFISVPWVEDAGIWFG